MGWRVSVVESRYWRRLSVAVEDPTPLLASKLQAKDEDERDVCLKEISAVSLR